VTKWPTSVEFGTSSAGPPGLAAFLTAGIRGSPAASPFERQNHTRLRKESRAYVSPNSPKANQEITRLTFSDQGQVDACSEFKIGHLAGEEGFEPSTF
jgi:hypothetical protein